MPRITSVLVVLSVLATGSTAAAAGPTPTIRAAELNREASEHAKRGEWSVAAALLTEAYRLDKDPALLVNLAATELKANHAVDALHHLKAYLADPAADEKVKSAIHAEILPRALAMTGRIVMRFPAGANLTLDGEALKPDAGSASLTTDVMPGSHTVEIRAAGVSTKRVLDVPAGGSVDVQPEASGAPPPARASLAPPPPPTTPLASSAEDHGFWTAGNMVPVGLLVAGVAGAGVGVGFTLGANSAASQAGSCGPSCSSYDTLRATYNRDSALAVGLYAGAGALAGAALITWLVWPREHAEAHLGTLRLQPYASATQAGVTGEF